MGSALFTVPKTTRKGSDSLRRGRDLLRRCLAMKHNANSFDWLSKGESAGSSDFRIVECDKKRKKKSKQLFTRFLVYASRPEHWRLAKNPLKIPGLSRSQETLDRPKDCKRLSHNPSLHLLRSRYFDQRPHILPTAGQELFSVLWMELLQHCYHANYKRRTVNLIRWTFGHHCTCW